MTEYDESGEAFYSRGFCFLELEKYHKACEDFSRAIKMDVKKRAMSKAIEMAKGENSELYVLRAAAYKRMGELTKSWEDLDTAVEVDPDHISTYLDTLEMYITTETYRKALEYIEKHEKHVLEIGDERDSTLFLYLKATVYIWEPLIIRILDEI
ncbi:MAG: hypothetical protein GY760_23915 [Deltaproteobacteria bacterium]|nr:hypothetical protein [Deltaproteobacteria bacterium]